MDNLSEKIKQLRNEYSDSDFLIEHLDKNPVKQFTKWLDDAIETKIYEPNAMVLATSVETDSTKAFNEAILTGAWVWQAMGSQVVHSP